MSATLPPEEGFLAPPPEFTDPETAGVIVLPAPFEATSSYGRNSCHGPAAILDASHQVEFFDAALGCEPFRSCGGIATTTSLNAEACDGEAFALALYEATTSWLDRTKFVVTLGGEHTSVIGAVRAHCERFADLTVLQFDAHSDLRESYDGSAWNHACAMARVWDFHKGLVQVGIRSQAIEERQFAQDHGIPNFYAHAIHQQADDREDWMGRVLAATQPNVYITFDCDVFDPSAIPATGTPEPGGLTWRQIDQLLARLCRERNVVGLDVSELAPIKGNVVSEFTIAKLIYRAIGYRFMRR